MINSYSSLRTDKAPMFTEVLYIKNNIKIIIYK